MCNETIATIWEFKTKNFTIRMTAEIEHNVDISFDDTGEIVRKLETGEYVVFCAKAAVLWKGCEIGTDYLGGCIYTDFSEFRDHIGMNAKHHGSYFSDMIRAAIEEARETLVNPPALRMQA